MNMNTLKRKVAAMKRERKILYIVALLTFIPLAVVVPLLTFRQFEQSDFNLTGGSIALSRPLRNMTSVRQPALLIFGRAVSFDPISNGLKILLDFYPLNGLSTANNNILQGNFDVYRYASSDVLLGIDGTVSLVENQTIWESKEITVRSFGNVALYPFDSYDIVIPFGASRRIRNEEFAPLSLFMAMNNIVTSFEFHTELIENEEGNANCLIKIYRSRSTKFFSVFLMISQWVLTLTMFFAAVRLSVRGHKVEPPMIAASVAMLFSLPSLRNTQPSVPAIGAVTDYISFFWCMIMASITLLILLLNYIYHLVRKKNTSLDSLETKIQSI